MDMSRTSTLVIVTLVMIGLGGPTIAQTRSAAPATPAQPLSDDEIIRRMDELNRRAATQPDAPERQAQRKALDAEYIQHLRQRSDQDSKDVQKNARLAGQIAGIDVQLRNVRAEGIALERYRDQVLAQQQGDLNAASAAGHTEVSGVVGHSVFSASSDNPYVSLQAVHAVQERYGMKLEPINNRIAELASTQQQLATERESLRRGLYVHARDDASPEAAIAAEPKDNDKAKIEAMYPGVDVNAVFNVALEDAARDMGIDPKALPQATTPLGKALNTLANKYFRERAAAAVKARLEGDPVTAEGRGKK